MLFQNSILEVDYRIDGDQLFCHYHECEEQLVPWGQTAGAWRRTGGSDWLADCPSIDIEFMERLASTSRSPRPLGPWQRSRIAACQFLVNAWALHVRDLVRRFPAAQWELLMFLNDGGDDAYGLLESNPALGFLVATRAFAARGETASLLAATLSQKRRHLADQFGFAPTEASLKMLQKVPPDAVTLPLLDSIREALRDHRCERVLAHLSRITPAVLKMVMRPELFGRFAPTAIRQLERISPETPHFDILGRLEDLVDSASRKGVIVPMIRSLRDIDAAFRRSPSPPPRKPVREPKARFPEPPLPETETIRAIRSRSALRQEGHRMHHCIGTNRYYLREILGGNVYAYRVSAPMRLTLAIRRVAGEWQIGEVKGFENALPTPAAMTAIKTWLRGQHVAAPQTETQSRPQLAAAPLQSSFEF